MSADALELYQQAQQQLDTQGPGDAAAEAALLSSNIAAVLLKLDRPQEALEYATTATQVLLKHHWIKYCRAPQSSTSISTPLTASTCWLPRS